MLASKTMNSFPRGNLKQTRHSRERGRDEGKTQNIVPSMPLTCLPTSSLPCQWFSISFEYFFFFTYNSSHSEIRIFLQNGCSLLPDFLGNIYCWKWEMFLYSTELMGPEDCSQSHTLQVKVRLLLYAKHLIGILLLFYKDTRPGKKQKEKRRDQL